MSSATLCKTIHEMLALAKPCVRRISFFKKSKKKVPDSPYMITKATKEEFDSILKLMHQEYFSEEPTTRALGITCNPVLDESVRRAMSEGLTLVAKCKYNGCIVGACINESAHPWDPEAKEKLACHVQCAKTRQLLLFYAHLQRAPDVWRCAGVQQVFEMAYLFVKKSYRRKGIAFRLLQESKALGADCGFGIVRCDATNIYTAKLCERLKMTKALEIPYCTYLNKNLEPIFNPPYPHDRAIVYLDNTPQMTEYKNKLAEKNGMKTA